jgi:pilus assembly protein CpaE
LGSGTEAATGRIVAVVGAKGGVGTTTMAQALSLVIAETLQEHALLLDLCGASGTLGIALGAEAKQSIEDILSQSGRLEADVLRRAAVPVGDRLLTIPGGRPAPSLERQDASKLERLLETAASVSPLVIVDLPSGWGPLAREVAARADHVVLVSTPMLGSLRNAHAMAIDLKERRGADAPLDLVMNFSGAFEKAAVAVSDAQQTLGLEAAAVVSFAPAVFAAAETAGQPMKHDRAGRRALEPLLPLARRIAGMDDRRTKPARRRAIFGLF